MIRKIFHNPWTIGISTSIIAAVFLSLIYRLIPSVRPVLLSVFSYVKSVLFFKVNFGIQLWIILLMVFIYFIYKKFVKAGYFKYLKKSETNIDTGFPWKKFRSFRARQFVWTWDYDGNTITEPIPLCPGCFSKISTMVDFNDFGRVKWICTNIDCPFNKRYFRWEDGSAKEIANTVLNKIKTGEYEKLLDKQIPPQFFNQ